MINLPIAKLLGSYTHITDFSRVIGDASVSNKRKNFEMRADLFATLIANIDDFIAACDGVGLRASHRAAVVFRGHLMKISVVDGKRFIPREDTGFYANAAMVVMGCVYHESITKVALVLPPELAEYFEAKVPLFGQDVNNKFPSATFDIDEAGKCLAIGRSTAAVFHLMRATEVAVRAVHECLGINTALVGQDKNWGNILNRIRDNYKARKGFAESDLFQTLYASLDAVKDAWRNSTMHIENKYTPDEAMHIFNAVRGLMVKVAARMDEKGLPLA